VIRGTLYFQIKMRMKHAENYVAIYDTLRAMLFRGGKHDLVESFPLVFSIQKFATKWKKIPPIRAYTIHTLVAAYLYCVANLFYCAALEVYVNNIMQEREKKGHICSLVSLQKHPLPGLLLSSIVEYSLVPQKKVAVEYILFDRQSVVDMLCPEEGGSTLSSEKGFFKVLMKKFRNQTDTMTMTSKSSPLNSTESTYFLPASPISATIVLEQDNLEMQNIVTPGKSLVIFSSEPTVNNAIDDKLHKNTKIDIISMKRALVVGVPLGSTYKHPVDYSRLFANCNQKRLLYKQVFELDAALETNDVVAEDVFKLDLLSN